MPFGELDYQKSFWMAIDCQPQLGHCNHGELCDPPVFSFTQGWHDVSARSGTLLMLLSQNVDGEDREELLSLQQRLQSKIQVCTHC